MASNQQQQAHSSNAMPPQAFNPIECMAQMFAQGSPMQEMLKQTLQHGQSASREDIEQASKAMWQSMTGTSELPAWLSDMIKSIPATGGESEGKETESSSDEKEAKEEKKGGGCGRWAGGCRKRGGGYRQPHVWWMQQQGSGCTNCKCCNEEQWTYRLRVPEGTTSDEIVLSTQNSNELRIMVHKETQNEEKYSKWSIEEHVKLPEIRVSDMTAKIHRGEILVVQAPLVKKLPKEENGVLQIPIVHDMDIASVD